MPGCLAASFILSYSRMTRDGSLVRPPLSAPHLLMTMALVVLNKAVAVGENL